MRPSRTSGLLLLASFALAGCAGSPNAANMMPAVSPVSAPNGTSFRAKLHPLSARAMPIGQSAAALCGNGGQDGGQNGQGNGQGQNGQGNGQGQNNQKGSANCHGLLRTDITPNASAIVPTSSLPGLQPNDLLNAYGLSGASGGSGQTVAVVVAYDNSALESDLAVYRHEFGLPACSVASGCLTFAYGKKVKPSKDPSWSAEADLDVEMVSAICPKCRIIVAEAPSNQIGDLAATVGTAVAAGATVVSNSYSVPEDPSLLQYDAFYNVPGIPMTAGAGDGGYGGVGYPASSPYVTAVGGTTLQMANGSVLLESVWGSTGSGCSQYETKPGWQTDSGCTMRTANDVAVVADPATGVATYMSGLGGWNVFGGTSVGAPLVASMYALAGNGRSITAASNLYANSGTFHSILGSSGTCSPTYLCNGSTGYNGPAGLGTPFGLTAF